jgi:hypothetical protein
MRQLLRVVLWMSRWASCSAKARSTFFVVIPAKAGIQWLLHTRQTAKTLGPGYRFTIPG